MNMKGLVPRADPPGTKAGHQVVRAADSTVADQGVGAIVPRHDPYANRAVWFPDNTADNAAPSAVPKVNARQITQSKPYNEDFDGQGKPPIYATAHRRLWMSTNIPSILSFDGWPPEDGYFAKWIRSNRISVPRGFQAAIVDPVLIDTPASVPDGSRRSIPGTSPLNISDLYV